MNLLTKALVVVVTILSVVLVALVVPFAAQTEDYRQQYSDKVKELEATLAASDLEVRKVRNEMAGYQATIDEQSMTNRALSDEAEQLRNDKVDLEVQLARANTTLAQQTEANNIIVQVSERKDQQINTLSQQLTDLTGRLGELNNANNQLDEQIINVRAQNRQLTDNYRRIQERLQALETELAEARDRNAMLLEEARNRGFDPNATTVTVPVGLTIEGAVVQVESLGDGSTHVLINVGSRDQVQPGMKFQVSRGDQFICNVDVLNVDVNESVATVTLGGGVQAGDTVEAVNH